MPEYQPIDRRFRAYRWWGDINVLPADWLERGKLTFELDGTLICETYNGPSHAPPDGSRYVREHAAEIGDDELWPVETPIFEATYRAVQ